MYFGSSCWLWYAITALSMLRLRTAMPDLPRPFRSPLVSARFVAVFALVLTSVSAFHAPVPTATSLGFVALAFPVARLAGIGERRGRA